VLEVTRSVKRSEALRVCACCGRCRKDASSNN